MCHVNYVDISSKEAFFQSFGSLKGQSARFDSLGDHSEKI